MKTILFLFVALTTLSSDAFAAKSCIPGPSNPGGCMGIPDTLSNSEDDEGRDSGGGGRDSGGISGRDSGGTGDETIYTE